MVTRHVRTAFLLQLLLLALLLAAAGARSVFGLDAAPWVLAASIAWAPCAATGALYLVVRDLRRAR